MSRRASLWWWLLLLVAPASAVVATLTLPEPSGHWSGHAQGAFLGAGQFVAVGVATWLARRSLSKLMVVILVVIAVGVAFEVVGNYQVADSIWATPNGDSDLEFAENLDGFKQGHDKGEVGDLILFLSGIALVVTAGITRKVRGVWLAIAGVLCICPPFFVPALAPLVVLLRMATAPPDPVPA